MQEKEFEFEGGSLYYEKKQNAVIITRFQGLAGEVTLPGCIEELPVRTIGKKAFLSKKNLRKITLPESIEEIGDWAFAYCDSLTEIFIGNNAVTFGRNVFMECAKLGKIRFPGAGEHIPALLAAAVTVFEAAYLLDIQEAAGMAERQKGNGEGNPAWLEKWDARLLSVMHAPDGEGYSRQVLCGEEDYGSTDYEAFLSMKRKRKVRLALLRLLHPVGLSADIRAELEDYLREHTKGCESEEAWQVILTEHGNDREYYSLFAEISCITEENCQQVIGDIGEDFTEMKAYFMRWKEEKIGVTDFFDTLEL